MTGLLHPALFLPTSSHRQGSPRGPGCPRLHLSRKISVMCVQRIAICNALPSAKRHIEGTMTLLSAAWSSTFSAAAVVSSSEHQAMVMDASMTRLAVGLR